MKKTLVTLFVLLMSISITLAKPAKNEINDLINEYGVDTNSISISVKNANNGKVVYSLNDKYLINPASVQKIYTTPVIYETLGSDYEFTTELYARNNSDYLIKLGADPYLTTKDLKTFVKLLPKDVQKINIDNSVVDSKLWGEGWQWDDDLNTLMPKFGAYNLDANLVKLTIIPSKDTPFATILNPSKYPLVFFNNITVGDKTEIDISRDNTISSNTLILKGTVARTTNIYIPTNNLARYFNVQLTKELENRNIYLSDSVGVDFKKDSDVLVEKITHPISNAISDVLKNSNNLVSETMFKLAGAKYCNLETGTDISGIKMFNDYCKKNNIDNSRIRITDASGVSKNNLASSDFITEFLVFNKDNKMMEFLPTSGEGTLTHRMLPLKGNLKAKTGSLSDVSSIAGYLTTKSGKKLVFSILNNDMGLSASEKKMLEDFILREIYLRF